MDQHIGELFKQEVAQASPAQRGLMLALSAGLVWGDLATLGDHFSRHGADFGATSEEDYALKANGFYNQRGNYQVKVDSDGIIRVYDSKTNTFGSYNPDGTTRTFFKPTSPTYFDRQPGK